MKTFILATILFASTAFADQTSGVVEGDPLNAAAESRAAIEGDLLNTAPVIDNEEQSAENVKDAAVNQSGGSATGQARRRADVTMKDVSTAKRRTVTITNTGDESADEINGQLEFLSPNLEETENGFGNDLDTKAPDTIVPDRIDFKKSATDYNSSRPNRRGAQGKDETHTETPKIKRKLDTEEDGK